MSELQLQQLKNIKIFSTLKLHQLHRQYKSRPHQKHVFLKAVDLVLPKLPLPQKMLKLLVCICGTYHQRQHSSVQKEIQHKVGKI